MNNIQRIFAFLLLSFALGIVACEVVELDSPQAVNPGPEGDPDGGNGPNPSGVVTGPDSLPQDEDTFLLFLAGDSAKTWNATQFTIEGISGFQDCRLDDRMTLLADGTYIFDGGTANCGGGDQAQAQGTWRLDFESATLFFTLGPDESSGQLIGLEESTLVILGDFIGLDIAARYDAF